MSFTVVDCNGLNGALSRGMVLAGGNLLMRTGYLTLGQSIINANAHLWGTGWEDALDKNMKGKSDELPMPAELADVVVAVPPCSGFSVMTGKGGPGKGTGGAVQRSVDHPSNDCMWDSVRYAARHSPEVYMFESVTGAYKLGLEMMRALRAELEAATGELYSLSHWLHDGCTLGAPTSRQRYMFVAVKGDRPFAVTPVQDYAVENFTTVRDAVEDLEDCVNVWEDQPITASKGGAWAHERQRPDLEVDGMMAYSGPTWTGRILRALAVGNRLDAPWLQGRDFGYAMRRLYQVGGREALIEVESQNEAFIDRMIKIDFSLGPYATRREVYEAMHNLIAGGGTGGHLHPTQDRLMTYRELARIQGWPDELLINFDKEKFGKENIEAVWGKAVGCSVSNHAGLEVRDFLANDTKDKTTGTEIGDREWLIDELDESRRLRRMNAAAKKQAREEKQIV